MVDFLKKKRKKKILVVRDEASIAPRPYRLQPALPTGKSGPVYDEFIKSGVITSPISDHLPVFIYLNRESQNLPLQI